MTRSDAIWQAERVLASLMYSCLGKWGFGQQKSKENRRTRVRASSHRVRLKVIQAYHNLLKAEKDIALVEAAHKAASEYARITDLQVALGLATEAQRISAQKTLADSIAAQEGLKLCKVKKQLYLKKLAWILTLISS